MLRSMRSHYLNYLMDVLFSTIWALPWNKQQDPMISAVGCNLYFCSLGSYNLDPSSVVHIVLSCKPIFSLPIHLLLHNLCSLARFFNFVLGPFFFLIVHLLIFAAWNSCRLFRTSLPTSTSSPSCCKLTGRKLKQWTWSAQSHAFHPFDR